MIIRGQSPPLPPSSYVNAINRDDNQTHLIEYTSIEKISQFLALQYVKISMWKYLQKQHSFAIDLPKKTKTFITFVKLITVCTEVPL